MCWKIRPNQWQSKNKQIFFFRKQFIIVVYRFNRSGTRRATLSEVEVEQADLESIDDDNDDDDDDENDGKSKKN